MTQDLTATEKTFSMPLEMNYLLLQQSLHLKTEETWICGVNTTRNMGTHFLIAVNWRESLINMLMKKNWIDFSTVVPQKGGIILNSDVDLPMPQQPGLFICTQYITQLESNESTRKSIQLSLVSDDTSANWISFYFIII